MMMRYLTPFSLCLFNSFLMKEPFTLNLNGCLTPFTAVVQLCSAANGFITFLPVSLHALGLLLIVGGNSHTPQGAHHRGEDSAKPGDTALRLWTRRIGRDCVWAVDTGPRPPTRGHGDIYQVCGSGRSCRTGENGRGLG